MSDNETIEQVAAIVHKATCASCRLAYNVEDMQPAGANNLICNECNSLKSRIFRLDCASKKSLKELTPEDRVAFNVKAKGMCGATLAKCITETVFQMSLQKQTTTVSKYGDLELYSDVQNRYKDKPETWKTITENAVTTQHPVTGESYIWLPKLHIDMSEHNEFHEIRKRQVESEETVRPKKAPRTNKKNQGEAVEDEEKDGKETLTSAVEQKLQAHVSSMQKLALELEGQDAHSTHVARCMMMHDA